MQRTVAKVALGGDGEAEQQQPRAQRGAVAKVEERRLEGEVVAQLVGARRVLERVVGRAVPELAKRGENGILGGLWLEGHGLSVKSDLLDLSSRVPRAAPSLQTQSVEPVVASCGANKTATLAMLRVPLASEELHG